jgi:predicted nucleotidyltransferase
MAWPAMEMSIDKDQINEARRLAWEFNLRLVLLFGSFVTGKLRPESDIDIAVKFPDVQSAREHFFDVMVKLQGIFLDRKVDLALINTADPLFLKKILENCQLLYGTEGNLHKLRLYAFKRYIDHKRYLRLEEEYIRRQLTRFEKGAA